MAAVEVEKQHGEGCTTAADASRWSPLPTWPASPTRASTSAASEWGRDRASGPGTCGLPATGGGPAAGSAPAAARGDRGNQPARRSPRQGAADERIASAEYVARIADTEGGVDPAYVLVAALV